MFHNKQNVVTYYHLCFRYAGQLITDEAANLMKDDTYLFDLDVDVSVRDCIVATNYGCHWCCRVKWTAVCASMLVSTAMSVALLITPVSQMSFLCASSLSTMYVKSCIIIYLVDTVNFT